MQQNRISALIIDDNQANITALTFQINQNLEELELAGSFCSIKDGLAFMQRSKPEILFVNISLIDLIDFKSLDLEFVKIIFLADLKKIEIHSFRCKPIGFLCVPFEVDDLKELVERAIDLIAVKNHLGVKERVRFLMIPEGNKLVPIKTETILFCESKGNYTQFILNGKKVLGGKPLSFYTQRLMNGTFVRIHKSYLVNINFIEYIYKSDRFKCKLTDGTVLPVSRRKRKEVIDFLTYFYV